MPAPIRLSPAEVKAEGLYQPTGGYRQEYVVFLRAAGGKWRSSADISVRACGQALDTPMPVSKCGDKRATGRIPVQQYFWLEYCSAVSQ
jgi:hypothetical protein